MTNSLKKKAESILYFMEKEVARHSLIDFLDDNNCTLKEWGEIKREIAKSGIEFTYGVCNK